MYTFYSKSADDLAERMIGLGELPLLSPSQCVESATVGEIKERYDNKVLAEALLMGAVSCSAVARNCLDSCKESPSDIATISLIEDFCKEQSDYEWKLKSYLDGQTEPI